MKNVIDMTQFLKEEEKSPVYAVLQIPAVVPRQTRSILSTLADLVDLVLSLILGAGLILFLLLLLASL